MLQGGDWRWERGKIGGGDVLVGGGDQKRRAGKRDRRRKLQAGVIQRRRNAILKRARQTVHEPYGIFQSYEAGQKGGTIEQ